MSEVVGEINFRTEFIDGNGLDEQTAAEMRRLILDRTIELPLSGRSSHERRGTWDKEGLIRVGKKLMNLLQGENEEPMALTAVSIDRASKLGLGPSHNCYTYHFGSIDKLQNELGVTTKSKFSTWSYEKYIEEGQILADEIGKRPTTAFLEENPNRFPSRKQILKRFGNISTFYELIGRPNFDHAEKEDLIEWGTAVVRQNPEITPMQLITKNSLNYWSKQGRGPSQYIVRKVVGTIKQYRELVNDRFEVITILDEEKNRQKTEKATNYLQKSGFEIAQRKRHYSSIVLSGMHKLARNFAPNVPDSEINMLVSRYSLDGLISTLIKDYDAVDFGDVEVAAEELHIFDDLWPTYRFQNVDLVYPSK
jgi:hypothetical protein